MKRSENQVLALQHGFTLVELVIVIVVLGILAAVGIMNLPSPAELSLPSQAEKLASDIRYAQTLAHTTGTRIRLTVNDTKNYTVDCVPTSCPQSSFSGQLEKGVALTTFPAAIEFDTLGQPSGATTPYTLTYDGSSKSVHVAALTGFVTVTTVTSP